MEIFEIKNKMHWYYCASEQLRFQATHNNKILFLLSEHNKWFILMMNTMIHGIVFVCTFTSFWVPKKEHPMIKYCRWTGGSSIMSPYLSPIIWRNIILLALSAVCPWLHVTLVIPVSSGILNTAFYPVTSA